MVKDHPPADVSFQDRGVHRLRDLSASERVFVVHHPRLEPVGELQRSLDSHPNNLPLQGTSFVGRDQELAESLKLLDGGRLLTITGVGGSGKTRLALQVATSVLDRYPDGVWLVELAAVAEPEGVIRAVAGALGVREEADRPLEAGVVDHLRSRQLLLILDNCEHLLDVVAGLTQSLLRTSPNLSILATSREMLGVPGEVPFQLRSMALPGSGEPTEVATRYDAVRLFSARAEAVRAGFRVSNENVGAVVSLCQRLDGMPLAIELAAARLRMLSPEQIASRLDDRFRLLTGGSRTALPRQQTLQAAIDWSYDLLDRNEKLLFNRLSVFQGGFTLEAAEDVCGINPLESVLVLDLLAHLFDKSLVSVVEYEGETRYRLLETLRQYARERLTESGEAEDLREAHARYFRGLAEEALPNIRGPDEKAWQGRLEIEHDNLRQALRWAIDADRSDLAQGLAGSLYRFWMLRRYSEEGRRWLEQTLALSPADPAAHGRALLGAGTMAVLHGDLVAGRRHLEAALVALRQEANPQLTLAAIHNLALALIDLGEYGSGAELVAEELSLAEKAGDLLSMSFGFQQLASLLFAQDRLEEGHQMLERAIKSAAEFGSLQRLADVRSVAMMECLTLDDLDRAEVHAQHVAEIGLIETVPGRHLVVPQLVAGRRRNPKEAAAKIKQSMSVGIRSGADFRSNNLFLSELFRELAGFELAAGDPVRAAILLGGSEQLLKGARRLAHEASAFERRKAAVLETLPAPNFETAFAKGLTLDFEELFDFAMQ
jgi:non-specific serine/threonine protein kinase